MPYRPEIDGLRALAVLSVLFFHIGFEWCSGGYVGVDVFFVISGYLITTVIVNAIKKERFELLHFYERRARRILPALFFLAFFCIPIAWISLDARQMEEFGKSLIAVASFSSSGTGI